MRDTGKFVLTAALGLLLVELLCPPRTAVVVVICPVCGETLPCSCPPGTG